jgi:hypothetical protein
MSKRELVHRLLREAAPRGVTTAEFIEAGCGSRFGARVQELRDAGHLVDSKRLRSGSYLYTLRLPSAVPAEVGAVEPPQLFEAAAPAPANALSWGEAA